MNRQVNRFRCPECDGFARVEGASKRPYLHHLRVHDRPARRAEANRRGQGADRRIQRDSAGLVDDASPSAGPLPTARCIAGRQAKSCPGTRFGKGMD